MSATAYSIYPVVILSVEDNPADARMIAELFKYTKAPTELHFVSDGVEALDFLFKRKKYLDAIRPDLILLDLNLPKKDGREVLKELKSNPDLACIPVLIFTTSNSHEDIHRTYQLHANCYYVKPSDLETFDRTIKAIEENWLTLAKLPEYSRRHPLYPVN